MLQDTDVYEALGEEGFHSLVASFYKRVRTDDLIGPMYPDNDWEGAEQRLRDFLVFRFGGPDRYIQERGHPRLRGRHAPFPINLDAARRWVDLMEASLDENDITGDLKEYLLTFFAHVANFMRNAPD